MGKYFENVSKVNYEGINSTNMYSFKYYNPEEMIAGKSMKEHLRFAMSYWHTLCATGNDPFGSATMNRPWSNEDEMQEARNKVEAAFEFMSKLQIPYFCFHDIDIAPEGKNIEESNKNLDEIASLLKEKMNETGIKLLWGTTNLFSNPRFVHGASTSCNADVFAYSAAKVKKVLEITKELGGENVVFWGGREGYETLLNTNMELELDNFARFLQMAVDYKNKIGFEGQFLIEPKPMEPTKHQYDTDVSTVLAFLRKYNLDKDFKMNIEANHATLAGHTFEHELHVARINGVLGSVDANQGDPNLGWDTDQFPTDIYNATYAMYEILKNGGLHSGGLNFDSKVRRASFETEDLALGYISGMDTFAIGLKVASKLLEDKVLENFVEDRYSSYKSTIGKKIVNNEVGFEELEKYALTLTEIKNGSGRQEYLESIVNNYIMKSNVQ